MPFWRSRLCSPVTELKSHDAKDPRKWKWSTPSDQKQRWGETKRSRPNASVLHEVHRPPTVGGLSRYSVASDDKLTRKAHMVSLVVNTLLLAVMINTYMEAAKVLHFTGRDK